MLLVAEQDCQTNILDKIHTQENNWSLHYDHIEVNLNTSYFKWIILLTWTWRWWREIRWQSIVCFHNMQEKMRFWRKPRRGMGPTTQSALRSRRLNVRVLSSLFIHLFFILPAVSVQTYKSWELRLERHLFLSLSAFFDLLSGWWLHIPHDTYIPWWHMDMHVCALWCKHPYIHRNNKIIWMRWWVHVHVANVKLIAIRYLIIPSLSVVVFEYMNWRDGGLGCRWRVTQSDEWNCP